MARNTYISDDWDDNALTGRSNPETGAFTHPNDKKHAGDVLVGMYRPEWTVTSGSPSATSGYLKLPSDSTTESTVSTPTDFEIGMWEYDSKFASDPSATYSYYDGMILYQDGNNHWYINKIGDKSNNTYKLAKLEAGTATYVISGSWPSDGVWHTDKTTRDPYANWELFHDGTSQGTATDTHMPPYGDLRLLSGTNTNINKRFDNLSVK